MNNREIPGKIIIENSEVKYISDDGNDNFVNNKNGLFDLITSQFEIAKYGGIISENCKLTLPNGELFHSLSYRGDIEGWREEIDLGAEKLKLITGKVINDKIELSDGRNFKLSDCKIEFY
ncbi:hypothetical protein SAMN04489722_1243 [Algibacter lectus]|jgi:hypothetical protein|uniref:hypothetical protein n=1 Tax=Algibacter lectus TaxID=221126 RepID=UPI0008E06B01|nr:hypothetical protein [Algibacter lectus]SFD74055.1 hypothetical protein SAMN04489722_1243 [Algibacter lectus]